MEDEIDFDKLEHGQIVKLQHNKVLGSMNCPKDEDFTDIPCDGIVRWDFMMEGLVCSKCELYTGYK